MPSEGYDVAEASDGYTAVALCRQSTFDFVILAVMLPELMGFPSSDYPQLFTGPDLDPVREGR